MDRIDFLLHVMQYEQRSVEWYSVRTKYLTSSDVASVLNLNKYQTRDEILFKKCGMSSEFIGNEATLHGQKYEDEALDIYSQLTGRQVFGVGLIPYETVHESSVYHNINCDFLAGSADGISIVENSVNVLEVKAPFRRRICMGQIPSHYLPQLYMNMFILNVNHGDFIEYVPHGHHGQHGHMNIVRIYRDDMWLMNAIPQLHSFWQEVLHYRTVGIEHHPKYDYLVRKHKLKKK
jgi:putative phage-type endonuclease